MFPRFPMVLHPRSPVAREPLVSSFRRHSQRPDRGSAMSCPYALSLSLVLAHPDRRSRPVGKEL